MFTPQSDEPSPFSLCATLAERLLIGDLLCGRELLTLCLQAAKIEREPLQRAARELRKGKAKELADVVAAMAKTADRARWWRDRRPGRWRTASAQFVIDRRRAERRAASLPSRR
jgi:hypothetical protein